MVKQFNWRGKFYLTCCATFFQFLFSPSFLFVIFLFVGLFHYFSTAYGSPSFCLSITSIRVSRAFFHNLSNHINFAHGKNKCIMWKLVSQNRRKIDQWQNMSIAIWIFFRMTRHTESDKLFGSQVNKYEFFFCSNMLFWHAGSSIIKVF